MVIRESTRDDQETIKAVCLTAFGEPEGPVVSELAVKLLTDETALPVLSLVAEDNGKLVGSIIFSSVTVTGCENVCAFILCPLAVIGEYQGRGIGTELIERGLTLLKDRGAELVLVLGDPRYYTRSGFKAGHKILPPYTLDYPEAWMVMEIVPGTLVKTEGRVRCATCLHSPELW